MVMAAGVAGLAVGALMSGGPDIPGPDPSIGMAQQQMADLATRQENYYEGTVSPLLMDQVKQQTDIARRTSDSQVAAMDFQTDQSKKYADRYWNTQVPLEDQMIGEATSYDTTANRNFLAGQAGADVESARQAGQTGLEQTLRARGIDLGSGPAASAMADMNTQAILAKAGAMTRTRAQAQQMGWQMKGEAAALGRNLPSFGQGSASVATGAANSANAGQAGATGGAIGVGQAANQFGATQAGIYQGIGNLGLGSYQGQLQGANIKAQNDPSQAILGAATGYGMSYLGGKYSDRRLKKNLRLVGMTPRGTRIYDFQWLDGTPGRGVIAQDCMHIQGAVSADKNGWLMVDYSKV